jgi:hypothetical protein
MYIIQLIVKLVNLISNLTIKKGVICWKLHKAYTIYYAYKTHLKITIKVIVCVYISL